MTYARGCASGSYTRQMHSMYGLAFASIKEGISSFVFVYDKDNELRFVKQFDELALLPDIGANYDVSYKEVEGLLEDVLCFRSAKNFPDIEVSRFEKPSNP
jgi:hypothetical protein